MIISFDIDDTLIPYSNTFDVEPKPLVAKLLGAESIRQGTISLFRELKHQGHSVWIYTTSLRSRLKLRITFITHGLHPSRIINQITNQQQLSKHNVTASKQPHLFGIDVHVDDSVGVKQEGDKYGFKVILIEPNKQDWTNVIIKEIALIERLNRLCDVPPGPGRTFAL